MLLLSASTSFTPSRRVHSRPKNRARVVSVPYSFSNRSISGVSATTLSTAWITLRWMSGKVFNRYAARLNCQLRSIARRSPNSHSPVAKLILSGIIDPHCRTSHTDCSPTTQKRIITSTMARVNSGSLDTYDRARSVLNPWTLGISDGCACIRARASVRPDRSVGSLWFCRMSLPQLLHTGASLPSKRASASSDWASRVPGDRVLLTL